MTFFYVYCDLQCYLQHQCEDTDLKCTAGHLPPLSSSFSLSFLSLFQLSFLSLFLFLSPRYPPSLLAPFTPSSSSCCSPPPHVQYIQDSQPIPIRAVCLVFSTLFSHTSLFSSFPILSLFLSAFYANLFSCLHPFSLPHTPPFFPLLFYLFFFLGQSHSFSLRLTSLHL